MIRAVFDANVLVSAFPAKKGTLAELIERLLLGEFALVTSEHILTKMKIAWEHPYFQARFTSHQIQGAERILRERAELVVPVDTVHNVADDEEDDLVLATAVAGGVPYLVTGDHGFQRVGRYGDIVILSPRAFLDVLGGENIYSGLRKS